jgi:hypothetical protein
MRWLRLASCLALACDSVAGLAPAPHLLPGDLEDRATWAALLRWAKAGSRHAAALRQARTPPPEIVLMSTDTGSYGSALFTMSQLHDVGASPTLVHAMSPDICRAHETIFGPGAAVSAGCAWSSWAPGGAADIAPHQVIFASRKRLLKRLVVDGGLSVRYAPRARQRATPSHTHTHTHHPALAGLANRPRHALVC